MARRSWTVKSSKPVILIGAQCNASSSDFDGPHNLLKAARIAVDPRSRDKGVMLSPHKARILFMLLLQNG
jgi:L-asparaginase/Glu-tRNA(Gln) amidotransferase subunit D